MDEIKVCPPFFSLAPTAQRRRFLFFPFLLPPRSAEPTLPNMSAEDSSLSLFLFPATARDIAPHFPFPFSSLSSESNYLGFQRNSFPFPLHVFSALRNRSYVAGLSPFPYSDRDDCTVTSQKTARRLDLLFFSPPPLDFTKLGPCRATFFSPLTSFLGCTINCRRSKFQKLSSISLFPRISPVQAVFPPPSSPPPHFISKLRRNLLSNI